MSKDTGKLPRLFAPGSAANPDLIGDDESPRTTAPKDLFAGVEGDAMGDSDERPKTPSAARRGTRSRFLKWVLATGAALGLGGYFLCSKKEPEPTAKKDVPEDTAGKPKEPKKEKPVFIPPQKPLKERYSGTPDEPSPE